VGRVDLKWKTGANLMCDRTIAEIGRRLAAALNIVARTRAQDDKHHVAVLYTELCKAVREEEIEQQTPEEAIPQ
jgi:hypothetical protein